MVALFVIAVIVAFVLIEVARFALHRGEPEVAPAAPWAPLAPSAGVFVSPGHTWARLREDGYLGVGVDSFARQAMGEPDSWELPETGQEIEAGEPLLTAVRDGRRLTFRSPAAGTVVASRRHARASSSGDWMLTLRPSRIGEDLKRLFVGEESRSWFEREVARFREFMAGGMVPAPATLPDGGQPVEGALSYVDDESWERFEREFLADQE